ncbi:hypothetical protein KM043_006853 [Ampulex compressa]|nr:hypothetical protein KM043_006853 [Ampulex compressa]
MGRISSQNVHFTGPQYDMHPRASVRRGQKGGPRERSGAFRRFNYSRQIKREKLIVARSNVARERGLRPPRVVRSFINVGLVSRLVKAKPAGLLRGKQKTVHKSIRHKSVPGKGFTGEELRSDRERSAVSRKVPEAEARWLEERGEPRDVIRAPWTR